MLYMPFRFSRPSGLCTKLLLLKKQLAFRYDVFDYNLSLSRTEGGEQGEMTEYTWCAVKILLWTG